MDIADIWLESYLVAMQLSQLLLRGRVLGVIQVEEVAKLLTAEVAERIAVLRGSAHE